MEEQIKKNRYSEIISDAINLKKNLLQNNEIKSATIEAIDLCLLTFRNKRQVLFCGNGGSAADAQHLAAEFSGRFYFDRSPLNSEALHVNSSYLTAVANDYSYDQVYARLVKAKGQSGDLLFCLSTSGNSINVIHAAQEAKKIGIKTIGLTGNNGGALSDICDINIIIPSSDTPRIQESHILLGHIICELVERELFK